MGNKVNKKEKGLITRDFKLDFKRLVIALRRGIPDRVPFADLGIAQEIKDAFMGRPVVTPQDEVDFWVAAGYDFVLLDLDLSNTPQMKDYVLTSKLAEDYQGEHIMPTGFIRNRQNFEHFEWPTAFNVDFGKLEAIEPHLHPDMKYLVVSGHIFSLAWQLMGFEAFCTMLHDDYELVEAIVQRLGDETLQFLDKLLSYDTVGAVAMCDDIAYTSGPMISPHWLRKLVFPWVTRFAEICHDHGRPVIFHSDGKLDMVMEDIIRTGVDGLNPIEPKCMDIVQVKRKYGDRIALFGNVDLGYTLTRGTPTEVKDEVRYLIKHVAPGGGYILGSANSIPKYVPVDNFRALVEAAYEYGCYPIDS